jgi:hypothetical protein
VLHAASSHDSKLLALARADGVVSVCSCGFDATGNAGDWKPISSAELRWEGGPPDAGATCVNCVAFLPRAREYEGMPDYLLAAARSDGIVSVWNLEACVRSVEEVLAL